MSKLIISLLRVRSGNVNDLCSRSPRQPPVCLLEPRLKLLNRRLGDAMYADLPIQFGVDLRMRQANSTCQIARRGCIRHAQRVLGLPPSTTLRRCCDRRDNCGRRGELHFDRALDRGPLLRQRLVPGAHRHRRRVILSRARRPVECPTILSPWSFAARSLLNASNQRSIDSPAVELLTRMLARSDRPSIAPCAIASMSSPGTAARHATSAFVWLIAIVCRRTW